MGQRGRDEGGSERRDRLNPPTPFRGPAAGFRPARSGGFLPWGFSPSSRPGGVSQQVTVPVNIACKRVGPWYRRPPRKTATTIEEPVPSVGRRTERLVSTNLAAGATSWSAWFSGDIESSKYYPGNKEGHILTRSASEGPMKSSESRRGSPLDD
jgi:hypothetical protein